MVAKSDGVDESAGLNPLGFIFGGNTGLTADELKKRRAIAAALAARQKGFPKTLGEGLTYLGESIGEAGLNWRLQQAEAEARKYNQGVGARAPGETTGENPVVIAPPVVRQPASVVPQTAAPIVARPVPTVRVAPAAAPPPATSATPLATEGEVTTDAPREVPLPDTAPAPLPAVAPRPATQLPENPPPFFEGRPNNIVTRGDPSRFVQHLGPIAPTHAPAAYEPAPPPVVAEAPEPGVDSFADRFNAISDRPAGGAPLPMPGGAPVPYFEETLSIPQDLLPAERAPLMKGDRLSMAQPPIVNRAVEAEPTAPAAMPQLPRGVRALPRYSEDPVTGERTQVGARFASDGSNPDWRNQVSPEAREWQLRQAAEIEQGGTPSPYFEGGGAAAPSGTPLPRPRPDVEGGYNPIDQQGRYSPEDVTRWAGGIKGIESGGSRDPYSLLGAVTRSGDRAYGAYQMMGNNIPAWTEAALGRRMTPQEFLRDQQAQDDTFKHRFGGYVDRYGEEGAARAWYAGEKGMRNLNATDQHGRLTVSAYGQDYLNRAGSSGSPQVPLVAQGASPQQGTDRDAIVAAVLAQKQQNGEPAEASLAFTDPQGQGVPQPNPTLAGANLPPEITTGASRPQARSNGTSVAQAGSSRGQNPPIVVNDISPIPLAQRPMMGGAAPAVPGELQRGSAVPGAPGVDPLASEPIPGASQPVLTPPPDPPTPPNRLPPTAAQRYWDAVQRDPYASDEIKAHAKGVIAREEATRQWQQKQVDDNYNYQRARTDKLRDDYEKKLHDMPKEQLEQLATRLKIARDQAELRREPLAIAKAQADLNKVLQEMQGFETVTENGKTYQRRKPQPGEAAQPYERPAGLPDTPKDMAEHQVRHFGLYTKAATAADQYNRIPNGDQILAQGLRDELAGRVPYLNNSLVSAQYRVLRNAASNLITAHLRDTSGAVIGAQELAKHMEDLIPRYGDDALTLRNKAEQRKGITGSLYAILGETGQQQATKFDAERRATRAREQEKISVEMKDVPNATPGQIFTNPRTKKRRLLTLDGWEDLD